ncbi:hypothetical protein NO134_21765 [Ochrobactrum sp. BD22]
MIIAIVEENTLVVSVKTFAVSITAKEIEPYFHALTHFPERRSNRELVDLADRLNTFAGYVCELYDKGEWTQWFDREQEIEAFTRRQFELTRRYWLSESRCMNWFITGPANFPVSRNEKRMKVADARRADIDAHLSAARKAVKRRAFPHGTPDEPIRSGDPEALERVAAKIDALSKSIDQMKAANAIIRRMDKLGAAEDEIVKAVVEATGMEPETAMRGISLAHWQIRRGFDTTNSRAEIRRLQMRLKSLTRMKEAGTRSQEIETDAGAVEIRENAEIARIQLRFPGKPDETTRRTLKAHGFRWSPTQGAWQRHLNEAGRWAAQRVVSAISSPTAA